MRITRFSTLDWQAWKDGGGQTATLNSFPPGSGVADFEWRISIAKVAQDGPFSRFMGVDRILSVLDGQRMGLIFGTEAEVVLSAGDAPLGFSGETPCVATLGAGPIMDFNVMTKRAKFSAQVTRTQAPLPGREGVFRFALALAAGAAGGLDFQKFDLLELERGDAPALPAGQDWLDVEISDIRTMP